MQDIKANKHQLRSDATCVALLDAAEAVFLRSGYELAQMDEIARVAGRTTGAVYAHYKNKEELFFAVLGRRMRNTRERGRRHIARFMREHGGDFLAAMRSYYLTLYKPEWAMLGLEFRLYAMRRPK